MKKWTIFFVLLFPCLIYAQNQAPKEWNYQGDTGPQYWGDLHKEYRTCKMGEYQSPVNINTDQVIKGQGHFSIHYQPEHARLIRKNNNIYMYFLNDGNTSYVEFNQNKYYLRQMSFHTPSEHTINGKQYPLSLQIMNMNPSNKALKIAIMFDEKGEPNRMLQQLFSMRLPELTDSRNLGSLLINPKNIIPQESNYFSYQGSLTTPPCDEIVTWVIMAKPEHVSPQQVAAFKRRVIEVNARPVQPLNGRKVAIYSHDN